MMTTVSSEKVYSIEEYLTQEEQSTAKHEYLNGTMIEMSGGTATHNLIAARIITLLTNALDTKEKDFFVLGSDMKIHIPDFNTIVYPDALVICDNLQYYHNRQDILINPLLVVEILSPSTESYDRSGKFLKYRTIPSFKEYVLVRQDHPQITTLYRQTPDTWQEQEVNGLNQEIHLTSTDCTLALKSIYKGVAFEPGNKSQ